MPKPSQLVLQGILRGTLLARLLTFQPLLDALRNNPSGPYRFQFSLRPYCARHSQTRQPNTPRFPHHFCGVPTVLAESAAVKPLFEISQQSWLNFNLGPATTCNFSLRPVVLRPLACPFVGRVRVSAIDLKSRLTESFLQYSLQSAWKLASMANRASANRWSKTQFFDQEAVCARPENSIRPQNRRPQPWLQVFQSTRKRLWPCLPWPAGHR